MAIEPSQILQLLVQQLQGGTSPPISPASGLKETSLSGLQLGEQGMGFGGGGSILGGGGQGIGGGGTEGMGLDLLSLLNQFQEGSGSAGRTLGQFPTQFPSFGAGGLVQEPQGGIPQGTSGQAGMGGGSSLQTALGLLKQAPQAVRLFNRLFGSELGAGTASGAGLSLPFGASGEATAVGFPIEATGTAGPGGFFSGSGNIIPNLPGGGTIGATIPAAGEGTTAPFIAGGGPEAAAAIQAGETASLAPELTAATVTAGQGLGVIGGSIAAADIFSRLMRGRGILEGFFNSGQLAREQALAGNIGQRDLAALGTEQQAALAGQISPLQALQFLSADSPGALPGRNPVHSGLSLPLDVAKALGFPVRNPADWETFAKPPLQYVSGIEGAATDPISGVDLPGTGTPFWNRPFQLPTPDFFQLAPGLVQFGPGSGPGHPPNTLGAEWSGVSPKQFDAFLNAFRGDPTQFGGYVGGSGDVAKLPYGKALALQEQARQQAVNFLGALTTPGSPWSPPPSPATHPAAAPPQGRASALAGMTPQTLALLQHLRLPASTGQPPLLGIQTGGPSFEVGRGQWLPGQISGPPPDVLPGLAFQGTGTEDPTLLALLQRLGMA